MCGCERSRVCVSVHARVCVYVCVGTRMCVCVCGAFQERHVTVLFKQASI